MFTRILTAFLTIAVIFSSFAAFAPTDSDACEGCREFFEQMVRERENKLLGHHRGSITKPDGTEVGIMLYFTRDEDGKLAASVTLLPGDGEPVAFTSEVTGLRTDASRISFILNGTPVRLYWNEVIVRDAVNGDDKSIVIWGAHNNLDIDAAAYAAFNGIWRLTDFKPCGTEIGD